MPTKHEPRGQRTLREQQPDAARTVAAQALLAVEQSGAFANLILPRLLRDAQLGDRSFTSQDAAFAAELVYGTIRRQRTLDAILAPLVSRPLAELDPETLICLRMGVYQLVYMRVPDHAAVSESVSLARHLVGQGPSKMVNAVLRSVLREGTQAAAERILVVQDESSRLGLKHSHPNWIVDALRDSLTLRGDADQLDEALAANNEPAQVTLVARPGLIEPEVLSEEAESVLTAVAHQGNLSEYAVVLSGGDPGALPSIRSGSAGVQDEGSQLAALLLAAAPLEGSDLRWLDLCAGPGGKTALLAAIGAKQGVKVTANEVNPRRAKLVERSVQALNNVKVTVADGREFRGDGSYDRVLVDAPCLGLGSLRRRPESRWRHSEADLDELVPLQSDLLSAGIRLARPGGVIAWVTCSPHRMETVDQVLRAEEAGAVQLIDAYEVADSLGVFNLQPALVDRTNGVSEVVQKTIQLWPHRHGTDAMYIALLRKPGTSAMTTERIDS